MIGTGGRIIGRFQLFRIAVDRKIMKKAISYISESVCSQASLTRLRHGAVNLQIAIPKSASSGVSSTRDERVSAWGGAFTWCPEVSYHQCQGFLKGTH